ncbi:MAG: M42 family metallopeptidase, partial [Clostridia bacterium]
MLLKELCNLCAPSGWEDEARKFILDHITADEITVDTMGNIIAHKKGEGKKVMVAAHMDEVGFIVSGFTDEGFVKFKTVGGILTTVLVSKKVVLGEKKVAGIISAKAVHLQKRDEREKLISMNELYIDIGAKSKEEAEEMLSLGDYGTFAGEYTEFGDGCVKSKALDDRVGCAALIELMKNEYKNDMYFVFTVEEEVGLRGAIIAANRIKP